MPRWKPAKPMPHTNEESSKRFMMVQCILGNKIDAETIRVPLQYDWRPTRQQCASLVSVYLERPVSEIWVTEDPVIVMNVNEVLPGKSDE